MQLFISHIYSVQGIKAAPKIEYVNKPVLAGFAISKTGETSIIVGDRLFSLPEKDKEFVLAHESGHAKQYEEQADVMLASKFLAPKSNGWMVYASVFAVAAYTGMLVSQSRGALIAKGACAVSVPLFVGMTWAHLYSRHLEYDADERGVRALQSKEGALHFLRSLEAGKNSSLFSDHPNVNSRIARIEKLEM